MLDDLARIFDPGKIKFLFFQILSAFMPLVLAISGTSAADLDYSAKLAEEEYTGLYEVYQDYFPIGSSISSATLADPDKAEFVLKNFNTLTFEYQLKQPYICPQEGAWTFAGADAIADFARQHGLKLRGHTLLWGDESPNNWMLYDEEGKLVDKEIFYARLYDYMDTIIRRYYDVVNDWDVVNEACYWDRTRVLPNDALYKISGDEYLEKAFIFAREILDNIAAEKPDEVVEGKLFLNETKVLKNADKQHNLYKTLQKLIDKGVPVDGVGIQCHVETLNLKESGKNLDKLIKKFAGLKEGFEIQITELDMTAYSYKSQPAFPELPKWIETFQIQKYKDFFKVFRDNADVVTSVTFWGINDAHSYLVTSYEREDWGLMFDKDFKPKQSYYAACDFE